jgi:SAM-dependent methyltransferase
LRCPVSHSELRLANGELVAASGGRRYRIDENRIPMFAEDLNLGAARAQQQHYDRIAAAYVENLKYPHTEVYTEYLDRKLLAQIGNEPLRLVAEICCGRGEASAILGQRADKIVGLDVSSEMLRRAKPDQDLPPFIPIQGDATRMPLKAGAFDTVVMLGGIHHVNDRKRLFSEIYRILRPGGRLIYREPVSDFFLWKILRAVIYRLSPGLDHATERPLRWRECIPLLRATGFGECSWQTCGFLGFCFFMNSDILVFNRLFRFVPLIRQITRAAAGFDDWVVSMKPFSRVGLQVIGTARKPE